MNFGDGAVGRGQNEVATNSQYVVYFYMSNGDDFCISLERKTSQIFSPVPIRTIGGGQM